MKKLHNCKVWKVMGYDVFTKSLFRETENFWVFLKYNGKYTQEVREQKRGCNLFFSKEEAVAFAEKVLTDKVEKAKRDLEYMCKQQVRVVG